MINDEKVKDEIQKRIDGFDDKYPEYERFRFAHFNRDRAPGLYDATVEFTKNTRFVWGKRSGLCLSGKTGVGKTHLSVASVRQIATLYGETYSVLNMPDFWAKVKIAYGNPKYYNIENLEDQLLSKVLLLDDMDKGLYANYQVDILYRAFTKRYDRGGVTLITANVTMDDLDTQLRKIDPSYGDALRSRMLGCITREIAASTPADNRQEVSHV